MFSRISSVALVLGLFAAVGCSNAPARCDVDCTSDAQCGRGTRCMQASGGTGMACLPPDCSACPVGQCEITNDGCGFLRCAPTP